MDIEGFRKAGYAAVDAICDYYANLAERPVRAAVEPGYLVDQLPVTAPVKGEAFGEIASDFQRLILPGITHWQHPKFTAYFPSISSFESMIAELYSASVSNPGFNWVCSPACTELEQVTIDWMADILGLAPAFHHRHKAGGGGVILNSASEAALTAAIAARGQLEEREGQAQAQGQEQEQGRKGRKGDLVMYGSTQTHSLGAKAALILGVQFRAIEVDGDYRLKGERFERAVEEDLAAGLVPFFVIATVGTTSTGAVDCIASIGRIARRHSIYMHVDAAWAGVALALPEHRPSLLLDEINAYADSFCTNAHKWGLVGFDASLFFVRDKRTLNDALDVTPSFLTSKEGDGGQVIDYRNWQMALGRRFRSVKVWFVLRSRGVEGFQAHLRTGIQQAEKLSKTITTTADPSSSITTTADPSSSTKTSSTTTPTGPSFQLITQSLSLVVFRLFRPSWSDAEANLHNQRLHDKLAARHDVFVTQTWLHSIGAGEGAGGAEKENVKGKGQGEGKRDIFCIRIALGGQFTTDKDVEEVWAVVIEVGAEVLSVLE